MDREFMGDSLEDMSLRLSVDGEKYFVNVFLDNFVEVDKLLVAKGELELILDKLKMVPLSFDIDEIEAKPRAPANNLIFSNKYPALRNKKKLFVIAMDYKNNKK